MRFSGLFVVGVFAFAFAGSAQAQPLERQAQGACESGAVDPEALSAAKRVVVSARLQQTLLGAVDIMIPGILGPLAEAYNLTPEQQALVQRVVSEEMRSNPDDLIDMIAETYARRLSASDLNGIADFYESEAGQNLLSAMPTLQTDFAAVGQAWGESLAPRVRERIEQLSRDDFRSPT